MGKYLVVANQTAISGELADALLVKAQEDPAAQFVLVVPASPVEHLQSETGDPKQIAARRAGQSLVYLTDLGVPIVGAHVGAGSLVEAIDEAIQERSREYEGIILGTFPLGESRWFVEPDLRERLQASFHLPVSHIVARRQLL
jgi:hypothetical protein